LRYYTVISMIWRQVWVNNLTFVITHCSRSKNIALTAYSTVSYFGVNVWRKCEQEFYIRNLCLYCWKV